MRYDAVGVRFDVVAVGSDVLGVRYDVVGRDMMLQPIAAHAACNMWHCDRAFTTSAKFNHIYCEYMYIIETDGLLAGDGFVSARGDY